MWLNREKSTKMLIKLNHGINEFIKNLTITNGRFVSDKDYVENAPSVPGAIITSTKAVKRREG